MISKVLFIICCFTFSSAISFAQMTQENYHKEFSSLTEKKEQLNTEIKSLKSEIDSMNLLLPELEQKLLTGYSELYVMKYSKEIGQRVANKQIWLGMKDEMVKDGWGEPDKINKNVEPWGTFTQWFYGDITFFFKNSLLIDWQEGPGNK